MGQKARNSANYKPLVDDQLPLEKKFSLTKRQRQLLQIDEELSPFLSRALGGLNESSMPPVSRHSGSFFHSVSHSPIKSANLLPKF